MAWLDIGIAAVMVALFAVLALIAHKGWRDYRAPRAERLPPLYVAGAITHERRHAPRRA